MFPWGESLAVVTWVGCPGSGPLGEGPLRSLEAPRGPWVSVRGNHLEGPTIGITLWHPFGGVPWRDPLGGSLGVTLG